ncbi:MAG: lipopolysaccharide kinase InaA family protein [Planctomycetota bacterium]
MMADSLAAADAACLRGWLQASLAQPGSLPAGIEPVQTRLVRAVGVGVLPSGQRAFVKAMGFPRRRDRLRYWLRRLPAGHEADILGQAAHAGVACPEVLVAGGRRRFLGWPVASVLVTRALEVVESPLPRLRECAELARRLADAGIAHGDLHAGNFVRLRAGTCAVLDLQSARRRRGRVATLPLAARLLASEWPLPETGHDVVDAGLLAASDLPAALARAQALRRDAVRRRVARCWMDSTEFVVCRRFGGRIVQRRRLPAGGRWQAVGRDAARLWQGTRYLEVTAATPAALAAVSFSGWGARRSAVYVDPEFAPGVWSDLATRLLDAGVRYEAFLRAPVEAALDPHVRLPWTGSPAPNPRMGPP